MSFISLQFIIFLLVVFIIYWSLPKKWQWIILLISSYYFYMCWNVRYVILIFITTCVSWICALIIERLRVKRQKLIVIGFCLFTCLGILFVFKYYNFAVESVEWICSKLAISIHPVTLNLILPVGISFYTFQTMSYVIDVYRGIFLRKKILANMLHLYHFFHS